MQIPELGWRNLAARSSLATAALYLPAAISYSVPRPPVWSLLLGLSVQQRLSLQSWLLCSLPLRLKDLNARVEVEHRVWKLELHQCFWKRFVRLNPHSLLALLNAFLFFSVPLNSHCSPNWLPCFVFNDRAKVPKYFSSSLRNICNFFS